MDVTIPCPCPGAPHEEDTVTLRDKLGLRAGVSIQNLLVDTITQSADRMTAADITGLLVEGYLLYGIESWTLVDAKRNPVPVSKETITDILLSDFTLAEPIANVADGLYPKAVADPLVRRANQSSPPTPTDESTSAPPTTLRPKPSKQSSTTTTPTDGTETTSTSPDGVSRSSRNLELVGA